MLYNLLVPLVGEVGAFNLFRYITFRTGGAIITALVLSFLFGPAIIRWLQVEAARRPADPQRRPGKSPARPRRARRPWAAC